MEDLSKLRLRNKLLFGKYVNILRNLPEINKLLNSNKHKLSPFRIEQINETHRKEILNLMCYQFSCSGTVVLDQIFMCNVIDQESFRSSQIDHAMKTGLGVVAKDKHNHIVSFLFIFDRCDPSIHRKDKQLTETAKKRAIIVEKAASADSHKTVLFSNNVKYGEIIDFSVGATRPEIMRTGINTILLSVCWSIVLHIGYDYWIHEAVTTFSANMLFKVSKQYPKWHLSHSVFHYAPFVEEEFSDLKYKYRISDEGIEYLRKNANIHVFIDNYKLLRKNENIHGLREWFAFVSNIWSYRQIHKL